MRFFSLNFWHTFWKGKLNSRNVLLGVALLLSLWVGVRYAGEAYIYIAPILLWAYAILLAFAVLYPKEKVKPSQFAFSSTWLWMLLLLGIAFGLRLLALNTILTQGFHPDEAGAVDFSFIQIFAPENNGLTINPLRVGTDAQPILYNYILRWSIETFGFTFAGARLSSVIAGTLAIPAIFFMVDEMSNRRTAWLAAILAAVYHYHIQWSRIALSNIWVTLLIPLTLGLFLRGWRLKRLNEALLAGFWLGLAAYFYTGGYIIIFLFALLILQTWKQTENSTGFISFASKSLFLAAIVAMPLIVFAIRYPSFFFERLNIIYGWMPDAPAYELGAGANWKEYAIHQVVHSFGGWNYFPDVTGFYGASFPLLTDVSSVLFLVGLALTLRARQYFPVFWIVLVALFGGVMVSGTPSSSHYIGSIPAICWLVAVPLNRLIERKQARWAYLLLGSIIVMNLFFYFYVYAHDPSIDFSAVFPISGP
ncbi:MAG: glycosyltransferase family 39 protein [Anaerolineales bacterium]|nr:glycosyltransferase family 39 protein [Anaerolineales bacterium]